MKFLNESSPQVVFMSEGRQAVAGEAILSGATAIEGSTVERSQEELLEALVREHSRLVYRIAYAVLRSHADAEDATQETFLRVMRYGSKLAGVTDQRAWLARIAWRVSAGRRGPGRLNEISIDDQDVPVELASSEPAADLTAHGAQMSATIGKLIEALPEKLRQPLILSAIEEMTPREVGAALGINEAAVRSRVFRARQVLKEKLAQRVGPKG
jgi:RNA polymerase sigma-70 factor, ECF subfamily